MWVYVWVGEDGAGMRLPLMTHIIPLALGEDHLGLSVGLTSFASGLGSIIGLESAGNYIQLC